jgi:raffinose/stachyose/melibiose transport system permease protein
MPVTTDVSRRFAGSTFYRKRARNLRRFYPVLFLIPTFAFLILFSYLPFLRVLRDSLYWFNGSTRRFLGFDNYIKIFLEEPYFWPSIWVAVKFALVGLVKVLVFPLLAAKMIHVLRNLRAAYWYRLLLILPTVVPGLVILFIWTIFFHRDPSIGLFNSILNAIGGRAAEVRWLTDPKVAFWSLALVGFPWAGGFAMLIYLAGLQSIPSELYDAAAIDGASHWRSFWSIEIPLIRGQLKLFIILAIIGSMQNFTLPYIMTGGGPRFTTMVPGLLVYRRAFGENLFGYASAIAVVLFLITLGLSYLNMRFVNSKVEY